MDAAWIENVTLHRFRRTVGTVVNDAQGALLASVLLGHTDPRTTMQHYIQRRATVPEAPVDEHGDPLEGEQDVWAYPSAGEVDAVVHAVVEPCSMKS